MSWAFFGPSVQLEPSSRRWEASGRAGSPAPGARPAPAHAFAGAISRGAEAVRPARMESSGPEPEVRHDQRLARGEDARASRDLANKSCLRS